MLTVRDRLKRKRGSVQPIWIYLGVGRRTWPLPPKPDRKYYYDLRKAFRRIHFDWNLLANYNADIHALARTTLAYDSWQFRRRHLSALMWAYRTALKKFEECPFPYDLFAVLTEIDYETHNLYLRANPHYYDDKLPEMTALPPLLAARIGSDSYSVSVLVRKEIGRVYYIKRNAGDA